jgi:cob(I)alamin adenosyltransferase
MSGLVHIYTGDGKGKSTAAFGLALRAAGRGRNVRIVQFLKGSETGEVIALKDVPHVQIERLSQNFGFSFTMSEKAREEVRVQHTRMLSDAIDAAQRGDIDMLVLDEIISAYNLKLIDESSLDEFLAIKPCPVELVLTGRDPAPVMIESADYISDIHAVKHPYEQGVVAREGVEF